nr:glutaredoxin domain-containing cysteine-rich protein CG31559-like isoform X1 [Leptinotarsa decemlineata]XP_023017639.1 glutaredoxin domain-containing cysteine-rich protein CG31559-like isoform X1 [Leptinotarsa decemlineata]XP_023017640.1 glutaredoxin domain-containing cysteine-rich protein CG31559-like isoform X1 [Leptinotarsa decemlineata]XP_023017641.1 glutaredoxin domain-containing cysteine-rich protein CG31559-like isoform X1 [Leptinotarsa decemlineata]
MEETVAVPPPVPPKTKTRTATLQESAYSTVLPNGTTAVPLSNSQCESRETKNHVVKILISPQNCRGTTKTLVNSDSTSDSTTSTSKTIVNSDGDRQKDVVCDTAPCIRISLNGDQSDMVLKNNMDRGNEVGNNYFYYGGFNFGVMSSGQVSPSDTLDSGTCSDMDGTPPPASMKKKNGVSVTLIGSHKRAPSSSSGAEIDSDDNESNISCDSLNSGKVSPLTTPIVATKSSLLPPTLLQDIRQRTPKSTSPPKVDEKSYEDRKKETEEKQEDAIIDPDMFYNFHINEHVNDSVVSNVDSVVEKETFAGYRDILGDGAATIKSAKGTVRGVKNRVRAGIATFLQIQTTGKNYKEKEAGKVVVYTTTMGILRETYQACMKVKQILRLLLVKFEERDVFMSSEYQAEIQERMRCDQILVPQVFVDGVHVGDADTIERLNETGELRRILKPFKSLDVCTTCKVCGGFRLLPCQICKGSKKSVHRNHFTAEFVALKCMNCDEVGLVRCHSCS